MNANQPYTRTVYGTQTFTDPQTGKPVTRRIPVTLHVMPTKVTFSEVQADGTIKQIKPVTREKFLAGMSPEVRRQYQKYDSTSVQMREMPLSEVQARMNQHPNGNASRELQALHAEFKEERAEIERMQIDNAYLARLRQIQLSLVEKGRVIDALKAEAVIDPILRDKIIDFEKQIEIAKIEAHYRYLRLTGGQ